MTKNINPNELYEATLEMMDKLHKIRANNAGIFSELYSIGFSLHQDTGFCFDSAIADNDNDLRKLEDFVSDLKSRSLNYLN